MSKYIVDTDDFEPLFKVDSIGVFGIGKSVTDNTENHSWSRIKSLVDFEELNSDYINEHYGQLQDEAYKRGLEEGKKATWELVADASNAEYQKGFEDGKGAINKGCEGCQFEGTEIYLRPCSACRNAYQNQWTAKDDKIEVGDEVRSTYEGRVMEDFSPWVVTSMTSETCYGFDANGTPRNNPNTMVQKTGRHFDIQSILEDMRE